MSSVIGRCSLIRYDFDTAGFEQIKGKQPYALLDRHSDGLHVALQAPDSPLDRAGLWNVESRRLVWEPGETVALCWLPGGTEAGLVHYVYQPVPERHVGKAVIASPLQSEHSWSFERWSWPQRQLLRTIRIASPTGWFTNVVAAPAGRLVAALWMEQDSAGVELIELDRYGDRHVAGQGLQVDTNWVMGPVFSPDGQLLILFCGRGDSWWAPSAHDEGAPSPGGTFDFGEVIVYDIQSSVKDVIRVPVTVPAGWMPRQPWSHEDYLLAEGIFVNLRELQVRLPTDEVVTVQVRDRESGRGFAT